MYCFMDHTSRSMEDNGADDNDSNCERLAQEVSDEKRFRMLPKDHSCDILVNKVASFCPCLKSLHEANVKSSR